MTFSVALLHWDLMVARVRLRDSKDYLTNSSGQATNAHVFLFTKQHELVQFDWT